MLINSIPGKCPCVQQVQGDTQSIAVATALPWIHQIRLGIWTVLPWCPTEPWWSKRSWRTFLLPRETLCSLSLWPCPCVCPPEPLSLGVPFQGGTWFCHRSLADEGSTWSRLELWRWYAPGATRNPSSSTEGCQLVSKKHSTVVKVTSHKCMYPKSGNVCC